jgi:hypothetical protein
MALRTPDNWRQCTLTEHRPDAALLITRGPITLIRRRVTIGLHCKVTPRTLAIGAGLSHSHRPFWRGWCASGKPIPMGRCPRHQTFPWVDIPEFCLRQLAPIFQYISGGLLMYPFLSLRYASGDLSHVLREEGVFLGRLISGGLNHESDETMRSYVSQNVSRRKYEGLFLQSSKANRCLYVRRRANGRRRS